jgi:hypothetical protein
MESALLIEYMKYAVGKTQPDEVRELLDIFMANFGLTDCP